MFLMEYTPHFTPYVTNPIYIYIYKFQINYREKYKISLRGLPDLQLTHFGIKMNLKGL